MTTNRPTYTCECGKPATWFIREAGEPNWNQKAFSACDDHVLRALNHVCPERRAELVVSRVSEAQPEAEPETLPCGCPPAVVHDEGHQEGCTQAAAEAR